MRIAAVLLFIAVQTGDAQRVWGNHEGNISGDRYGILIECEDTLIAGEVWKKLESKSNSFWRSEPWWVLSNSAIRSSNGVVYHRDELRVKRKLYDYNLKIGDKIFHGYALFDTMKVLERDTVSILGKNRVRLLLESVRYEYQDEWIEGIGSTMNKYIYPGEPDVIFDGGSWSISFTEDGGKNIFKLSTDSLMSYLVDTVFSCSLSTSIQENNHFEALHISNPIDELSELKIYGLHDAILNVKLISVEGRALFDGDMKGLMTTKIKSGLFILVVQSSDKTYLGRLIVN